MIPASATLRNRVGRISRLIRFAAPILFSLLCVSGYHSLIAQSPSVPGPAGGPTGQIPSSIGATSLPPAQSSSQTPPAASPGTAGASAMLYPADDFRLGPGDLISVRIFLVSDYAATVRLNEEGSVVLPLIGSVSLRGLSVREAQTLIASRLREGQFYRRPEVIVQVMQTVNGTVLITGELRAEVPVMVQQSLRDVLLTAGGLPATASHTVKIVRRGEKEPIVVNLGADLASSSAADFPVFPRDIIQVTRASVVYVLGAFLRQGAVPLDQTTPLTLLQVASLSGGINFEGSYKDLRIIRTFGNERKFVNVDIKRVREGKVPDPILQPNDIVYLPTSNLKATAKSFGTGGVLALGSLIFTLRNY